VRDPSFDEVWQPIPEFLGYEVSDQGRVMNASTGRFMALLRNQYGNVNVGLSKGKMQYKRSVALLVCEAFNPKNPMHRSFDTPIHLNGDLSDNRAVNLMWRPRWFAMKYIKQFEKGPSGFRTPIQDIASKEIFPTSWEAALTYGLLDNEILVATLNRTYVWPTYQTFHVLPIKTDISS
jgi:hypothetical protein